MALKYCIFRFTTWNIKWTIPLPMLAVLCVILYKYQQLNCKKIMMDSFFFSLFSSFSIWITWFGRLLVRIAFRMYIGLFVYLFVSFCVICAYTPKWDGTQQRNSKFPHVKSKRQCRFTISFCHYVIIHIFKILFPRYSSMTLVYCSACAFLL